MPDLSTIASETGVKIGRLDGILADAIANDIRRQVDEGVAADWLPTQGIYGRAVELGLAPNVAKATIEDAISAHFTALVREILADNIVDPQEDARISRFMSMVGEATLAPDTARLLQEGRELYHAAVAPLSPVAAPVLLRKGEFCVYVATAEALEDRSRTVRVGYHGPSARVRLAKGVYYNLGSMNVARQTETYQHSFGIGALCMTNKRLLWISPAKSISTNLSSIVRYDPYSDGFRVMKGTGKPLLFLWGEKPRIATAMAARVIEEMRG